MRSLALEICAMLLGTILHNAADCCLTCAVQVQRVFVRPELPRNASNKVLRAALKQAVLQSQSKL